MAHNDEVQRLIDKHSHIWCMPLVLLINFALFQYLFTMYFARRKQRRIVLMLLIAAIGFLTMMILMYPADRFVRNMNDISELCCVLTFLMQITIIGRDVLKKVRVKSLRYLTFLAEAMISLGLVLVLVNLLELMIAHDDKTLMDAMDHVDNAAENAALAFTFCFRFYYMGLAKGWHRLTKHQRWEVVLYFLLMTHEYPFMVIDHAFDVDLEYVQALYMRILIALCLGMTIRAKWSSTQSKHKDTSNIGMGPALNKTSQFSKHDTVRPQSEVVGMSASNQVRPASTGPCIPASSNTKPNVIRPV